MTNHTANRLAGKDNPAVKTYPDFPLSTHTHIGRYCNKISGIRYCLCKAADSRKTALDSCERHRDDLCEGR